MALHSEYMAKIHQTNGQTCIGKVIGGRQVPFRSNMADFTKMFRYSEDFDFEARGNLVTDILCKPEKLATGTMIFSEMTQ